MSNKLSITDDEFADAIIAVRPDHKSIKEFLEQIGTPGPKEKHAEWQLVCDHIRQAKNIPKISRSWFKEAHRIFTENFISIEKVIWARIMQTPFSASNQEDVYEIVSAAIDRCHDKIDEISKKARQKK